MHATVGNFIVDCLQNSVEAGAALINLQVNQKESLVEVIISDNGCGMDERELERALDPFYTDGRKHVHRRVGLGIPFLKQAVDLAGGSFQISSQRGTGTRLEFVFNLDEVDSPPLGKLEDAFLQILMFSGNHEITILRSLCRNGRRDDYRLKRMELIAVLGNLENNESLILARDFLKNQEDSLKLLIG